MNTTIDSTITAQDQASEEVLTQHFLSRDPHEGNNAAFFYASALGEVEGHNFVWSVQVQIKPIVNPSATWVNWDVLTANDGAIVKIVPENALVRMKCDIFSFDEVAGTPNPKIRIAAVG